MLDLDDLIAGLIIEDQDAIPTAFAKLGMTGELMVLPKHQPFLAPDAATRVLERIHQSQPFSQPIPQSQDMPISPDLGEILAAASDLRKQVQSKEVTPLHLLAVTMRSSDSGALAFRDVGITERKVLEAIRIEDQAG